MAEKPARDTVEEFQMRVDELSQKADLTDDGWTLTNLLLTVGFLLGAGLPACAASVAVLTSRTFPNSGPFIWDKE